MCCLLASYVLCWGCTCFWVFWHQLYLCFFFSMVSFFNAVFLFSSMVCNIFFFFVTMPLYFILLVQHSCNFWALSGNNLLRMLRLRVDRDISPVNELWEPIKLCKLVFFHLNSTVMSLIHTSIVSPAYNKHDLKLASTLAPN